MTTAAEIRAEARAGARERLRDAVLDEARAVVAAGGWGCVRMGSLAASVGVSRQTLHNEFGTRDGLGQALVLREADAFLATVLQALGAAPDRAAAIRAATTQALQLLAVNPLLRAIVTAAGDDSLLPLLTTRGEPLRQRATDALAGRLVAQWPDADPAGVRQMTDILVRLVISFSVMPGDGPAEVGERLAVLFEAGVSGR